jgi:hypothetical protein
MPLSWRAAAATLDAGAALCATVNLAYFLDHLLAPDETRARRIAACALSLVSLGVLLESVFFLLSAPRDLFWASPQWALVRLAPFAGAALISLLIIRRAGGDPL